jgi:fructose-1-phosphate kinase PfkB-like protein
MGGRTATMIVTVTLNAALDVTDDVEALVPHATTACSKSARGRVGRA